MKTPQPPERNKGGRPATGIKAIKPNWTLPREQHAEVCELAASHGMGQSEFMQKALADYSAKLRRRQ